MDRVYKIAALVGVVLVVLVVLTLQSLPVLKPKATYALEISTYVEKRSESVNGPPGTLTLYYIPADTSADTSEPSTVLIKSYPIDPTIRDTIKIPQDTVWLLIRCDLNSGFEPDLRHTFAWNSAIYDYAYDTFYVNLSQLSQPEVNLELYFYGP
jgi:hypothetical protein